MPTILRVTWDVTPLEPPRIWRNCPSCRAAAPFQCTGNFRSNAQKKRIDVWLIYRCARCDNTWNLPVLERTAIGDITRDQLQAMAHNDPDLAARWAFDAARLSRHGLIEECADAAVARRALGAPPTDLSEIAIVVRLRLPWRARLERLLAVQLGICRNRLRRLHESGLLSVEPSTGDGVRAPIRDGQCIRLKRGPACPDLDAIAQVACAR